MQEKPAILEFLKKTSFWRSFLFILLVISMIPILAITPYNHSCADDYTYGSRVHNAFTKTANPVEIIKAIGKTVAVTYQTWQGTYSAIVLFSIQPAVWGEQFYFLSTYVLLAFLFWGIFSFFRSWIGLLYGRKDIAYIISCCVSILFLQTLPSPVEGLFWWNGASYYIIWNALMMVFVSQLMIVMQTRKCSAVKCLILALLGAILGGANLITALLTLEISVLFWVYSISSRNCWKQISIILLFLAVGFFINVFAPGNAIRQQAFIQTSPITAVLKSFYAALKWGIHWTNPLLITLMALLLPFAITLQPILPEQQLRFPLLLKLAVLFCLFASLFTPSIYVGTPIGIGRIQNIRFLIWIVICVVAEWMIVQQLVLWIKKKSPKFQVETFRDWFTIRKTLLFLCICLLLVGFTMARRIQVFGYNGFTSLSAAHSLLSGEAREYDYVADQRTILLLSSEKNVCFTPYQHKPFVLYFDDISDDAKNWKNSAIARFYGKETVILMDESILTP